MTKMTVAVDFDGTLHPYTDGWQGLEPADEPPVPGALDFCLMLDARGFDIVVYSARANDPEGLFGIQRWLDRNGFSTLYERVTHEKPMAVAYVDDRAVTYKGDWIDCLEQVEAFAAEAERVRARRLDNQGASS